MKIIAMTTNNGFLTNSCPEIIIFIINTKTNMK